MVARLGKCPKNHCFCIFGLLSHRYNLHQVRLEFRQLFDILVHPNLEAIESKANIEVSEEVGRAFVKFIYTGEIEEEILKDQAVAFLELGEKYDIQVLKEMAEAKLLMLLDKKNMVEFVSLGDHYNANKIFEAALKMTKANMTWLRNQVGAIDLKIMFFTMIFHRKVVQRK